MEGGDSPVLLRKASSMERFLKIRLKSAFGHPGIRNTHQGKAAPPLRECDTAMMVFTYV